MKILLISNRVLHYRSKIYNWFYDMFGKHDIEFHVVSNDYQKTSFPIRYVQHTIPFGFKAYSNFIKELSPDACIFFLHLKDKMFIPLLTWCNIKGIPAIYWGHGINLETPNDRIKNTIFHLIHNLSASIILYSEDQLKHITEKNRKKVFIAKNTLAFDSDEKEGLRSPDEVKLLYGIKEDMVVLYISRILPYKGLDILLDVFRDTPQIGLVVVGPGISDKQRNIIDETPNYYYLGEKYGKDVNELYNMGSVFSTPGHIGLALVQAMYWGDPVVLLNKRHAPEIVYLHNGENGFIVDTPEDLKHIILRLQSDKALYERVSNNAKETFEKEMRISVMFEGFMQALYYAWNNRKN